MESRRKRLYMRVGEIELRRWRGEASRAGLEFSEWVRRRLDGDAVVVAQVSVAAGVRLSVDRKLVADGFTQDDSGDCDPERDGVVGEEF